jgi:hypothetical protein
MRGGEGCSEKFPDQRYDYENGDTSKNNGIGPLLRMGNFEHQVFYHTIFVGNRFSTLRAPVEVTI